MNRLSAVDLQRFKLGPLHQSHPRITLRSLNVSGDEFDAPHLDVAKRLQAHCPDVEPAMWRPLKGTPTEIERVDVGGHQRLHQSTLRFGAPANSYVHSRTSGGCHRDPDHLGQASLPAGYADLSRRDLLHAELVPVGPSDIKGDPTVECNTSGRRRPLTLVRDEPTSEQIP